MARIVFFNYPRIYKIIQRRVSSLSKNNLKFFNTHWIKKIIYFLLVITSLLIAQKADYISSKRAMKTWHKENYPSIQAWKIYMKGLNMLAVEDLKVTHKVFRSLPIQYDENHSVWISKNHYWIGLFYPNQSNLFYLFTQIPIKKLKKKDLNPLYPKAWNNLGSGWVGFHQLTLFMEKNKLRYTVNITPPSPLAPNKHDHREIHY